MNDNEIIRVAHLMRAMDQGGRRKKGSNSVGEFERARATMDSWDMSALWFAVKLIEGKPYVVMSDNPEFVRRMRSVAGRLGGVTALVETDVETASLRFEPPGRH
jgi:hypothetical protein